MRCARQVVGAVRARTRSVVRKIRAWWRTHRDRMAEESGYAEAFLAVTLAAAELFTTSHRIRCVTHEVVAAYVAVMRAIYPRVGWEFA